MKLFIEKTERLIGEAKVPSSKSHTIRGFIFASLAEGTSRLNNVLESEDTKATINACKALGAEIKKKAEGEFEITGFNGSPDVKENKINTLNSGTTTNLITSVAALTSKKIIIDGDESIRKRPIHPLLTALNNLGAMALSVNKNGFPPIEIRGKMIGGKTTLYCSSSQFLSSLLITCPLVSNDTEIKILNLCEVPYIQMTLQWLDKLGIRYQNNDFDTIKIFGNQKYTSFEKSIPSDWSSATFLLIAAAMLGREVVIKDLDLNDVQADKEVLQYLIKMKSNVHIGEKEITIKKSNLEGCELDLNNTPDALPAMAVLGCHAKGRTILKNVAHARIKETDRIQVMTKELSKMKAVISETDDGIIVEQSKLQGTKLKGYNDHRIVMALSLAGLVAKGITEIDTAEAIKVTFPNYVNIMKSLGAKMSIEVD